MHTSRALCRTRLMSFMLNWDRIRSPAFVQQLLQPLNTALASLSSDYISSLRIDELQLPETPCPNVEILDIVDPHNEFSLETFVLDMAGGCTDAARQNLQLHVALEYDGDARAAVYLELVVNVPTPRILRLPLRLTMTHLCLRAKVIVAFVDDKVSFCLDQDYGLDMQLESQVGDPSVHVLKNVSKIERFVNDMVHGYIKRELTYPRFKTITFKA